MTADRRLGYQEKFRTRVRKALGDGSFSIMEEFDYMEDIATAGNHAFLLGLAGGVTGLAISRISQEFPRGLLAKLVDNGAKTVGAVGLLSIGAGLLAYDAVLRINDVINQERARFKANNKRVGIEVADQWERDRLRKRRPR